MLALGSSISLIASNLTGVMINKPNEFELGLTGIIGAAIFELTIGFAIGCLLIKKNYKISYDILLRDFLIFILCVILLYFFLNDKILDLKKVR
jgi:Ca2+/Na+ antiporter